MQNRNSISAPKAFGLALVVLFANGSSIFGGVIPVSKIGADGAGASASLTESGGVLISIAENSKGYPGGSVLPSEQNFFDLSAHSRIEAVVRNTGSTEMPVTMRIDNPGNWKDEPFSAESIKLGPGDTGTIIVFFGRRYGFQKGFPLDPSRINRLLFFTTGANKARQFTVESITAAGEPGETPESWQKSNSATPADGVLLDASHPLESVGQVRAFAGAVGTLSSDRKKLQIEFTGSGQEVQISPVTGFWNLRNGTQVEIECTNTGSIPVRPGFRIESRSGATDISMPRESIPPGGVSTVVIPFAPTSPWSGQSESKQNSGHGFDSFRVERMVILPERNGGRQKLEVRSICLTAPVFQKPEWLGKRPPVEGDWKLSFQEEFNGNSLDESKWNVYTDNYWDKKSHFSKDNVTVGDGVAKLRFEHKTGRHNDDPAGAETAYQTGFLGTYDKFRQKYGYFESRLKLPRSPGLWPAFWAMPDRGNEDGPKWKRSQTSRGGMEFDIVEHLTRWGPFRYNIAFHWDGYGDGHKHIGTSSVYINHDSEGFITAGLLWLPGKAVYYCNGMEIARWESPRVSDVASFLMFTHVSGGWDNAALEHSKLPDDFIIDYVRVWKNGKEDQ